MAINAENTGTTGARLGDGAMNVELRLPTGSLSDINGLSGFVDVETLCDSSIDGFFLVAERHLSLARLFKAGSSHAFPPSVAERRLKIPLGLNRRSATEKTR